MAGVNAPAAAASVFRPRQPHYPRCSQPRALGLALFLAAWPASAQAHGEGWIWLGLAGSGGLGGLLAGLGLGAWGLRRQGFAAAFGGYLLLVLLFIAWRVSPAADALALGLIVGAAAGVLPFALGFFPGRWLGRRLRHRKGPPA